MMNLFRIAALCGALVFGLTLSSHAQVPKATLNAGVASTFPDNVTGSITPAGVRAFLNSLVPSFQQYNGVNLQVGTNYTFLASDYGQLVTFNNASPVAVTLPQATGSFTTFNVYVRNIGAGLVTITPTASTINGGASIQIAANTAQWIVSDGSNYQTWLNASIGTGTSGHAIPFLDGTNTFSGVTVFSNATDVTTPNPSWTTSGAVQISGGLDVEKNFQVRGGKMYLGDGTVNAGFSGAVVFNLNGFNSGAGAGACIDFDTANAQMMTFGNSSCVLNGVGGYDATPMWKSNASRGWRFYSDARANDAFKISDAAAGTTFTLFGLGSGANGGESIIGQTISGAGIWGIGHASSILSTAYDATLLIYSPTNAYRFFGLGAGVLQTSANGTVSTGTILAKSNFPLGAGNNALNAGETKYAGFGCLSATESACALSISAPATMSNFICVVPTAPGAGQTITCTLRKNLADTTSTCTISNASTGCSDTTHTASYVQFDSIDIKYVASAGAASSTGNSGMLTQAVASP